MKDETGCTSTTIKGNTQASSNPFAGASHTSDHIWESNDKIYPCSHMIQRKESTKAVASQSHH